MVFKTIENVQLSVFFAQNAWHECIREKLCVPYFTFSSCVWVLTEWIVYCLPYIIKMTLKLQTQNYILS
jgi:hypothetical protein